MGPAFSISFSVLILVVSTVPSGCTQENKSRIRYRKRVPLAVLSPQSTSVAIHHKFGTNLCLEMDIGAANCLSEALFLNTNAIFFSSSCKADSKQ